MRCLMAWLLFCASYATAQVEITVTSSAGAPLKDALIIVQSLQPGEHELFRALTDEGGKIPARDLDPGLYRAIGTFPYSRWQTEVREFLVSKAPVKVQLQLPEKTVVDATTVSVGRLTVHVLDAKGQPVTGARVLVRDAEAHADSEHWGTTNAQGVTTLELTSTTAVLVVINRDQLYTFPVETWETERTVRLK
jgi:hypothetical protein